MSALNYALNRFICFVKKFYFEIIRSKDQKLGTTTSVVEALSLNYMHAQLCKDIIFISELANLSPNITSGFHRSDAFSLYYKTNHLYE